jgi:hypothetical protein
MKNGNPYFEKDYVESRHRYMDEIRALAEKGPPKPEKDWNVIYVFSGPEMTFEEEPDKKGKYNQTETRLKTGFELARKITALRLKKEPKEVTIEDIRTEGPLVHFDGLKEQKAYLRKISKEGRFENAYQFPRTSLQLSIKNITNTRDQVQELPRKFATEDGKIVFISDLYHLPRIQRYFGTKHDSLKIPQEKRVFYFPTPAQLSIQRALSEAKKLYPYAKKGDLRED